MSKPSLLCLLIAAAVCPACSLIRGNSPLEMPADFKLDSLDLYVSRASLGRVEFEQYKLAGRVFFHECGEIKNGRHFAREQEAETLAEENRTAVLQAAWKVRRDLEENSRDFDPPGENASPFDPGKFLLRFEAGGGQSEVKTSLDSITLPDDPNHQQLSELALAIRRSAGQAPCGNRQFYGLGPVKLPRPTDP